MKGMNERLADWSWTPEKVYEALGYEDPETYATRVRADPVRDEWRRTWHESHQAEIPIRQTGRTSRVIARAVAHMLNGEQVFLSAPSVALEESLVGRVIKAAAAVKLGAWPTPRSWRRRNKYPKQFNNPSGFVLVRDHSTP